MRRRRGCASSSRASTTPGCSTPTASRGSGACSPAAARRRPASCWRPRGSTPSGSGCCSGSPTRGSRRSSGRGWPASRTVARRVADELLPLTAHPGAAPFRAELLRHLARAGLPAEPFDGCPEPWAAGLRGDWRAAAAAWEATGDPYEQALELAGSGEPEPTVEGLRILDALGAAAAADRARERLREMGTRVPRGPRPATRANPAGLTDRQLAVLGLVSEGLTNAEIADRLMVSVRTVDHHVAAVLGKLGVRSRRDAAAAAHEQGMV